MNPPKVSPIPASSLLFLKSTTNLPNNSTTNVFRWNVSFKKVIIILLPLMVHVLLKPFRRLVSLSRVGPPGRRPALRSWPWAARAELRARDWSPCLPASRASRVCPQNEYHDSYLFSLRITSRPNRLEVCCDLQVTPKGAQTQDCSLFPVGQRWTAARAPGRNPESESREARLV